MEDRQVTVTIVAASGARDIDMHLRLEHFEIVEARCAQEHHAWHGGVAGENGRAAIGAQMACDHVAVVRGALAALSLSG